MSLSDFLVHDPRQYISHEYPGVAYRMFSLALN